jgi:hypothetical protein
MKGKLPSRETERHTLICYGPGSLAIATTTAARRRFMSVSQFIRHALLEAARTRWRGN